MVPRRTWIAIAVTLVSLGAATDVAAQGRLEFQPFVGARFGGGFEAEAPIATPFVPVDFSIDSGLAWGFTFGGFVSQSVELEFMLSRQESAISVDDVKLFDAALTQYHGNALFHFGEQLIERIGLAG